MDLNKAMLIGNITREPEIRQTANASQVASFSIATNMSWTDQDGQKQDRVEFHNIIAWKKLAEITQRYLGKGIKVYVEGRLQNRSWNDKDGNKRYITEIVAENIIILSKKEANNDVVTTPVKLNNDNTVVGVDIGDSYSRAEEQYINVPF